MKGTKVYSVPSILKSTLKLMMCAKKKNTKQKEIFHVVDPRTKQQKQSFEL